MANPRHRQGSAWRFVATLGVLVWAGCGVEAPQNRSAGETCESPSECESNLCHEATCFETSTDDDLDGLNNEIEVLLGLDPTNPDSDGDGLPDRFEVGDDLSNPDDEDGDGQIDALESFLPSADSDGDCLPDQKDDDEDATAPATLEMANIACCCAGGCAKWSVTIEAVSCEEVDGEMVLTCEPQQPDTDGDIVLDACDRCPLDAPDDPDLDVICESDDNCPGLYNPDQADHDGDGVGDLCDPCPLDAPDDTDEDGVCDTDDLCEGIHDVEYALTDADEDGLGHLCDICPDDADDDGDDDGLCADEDLCPEVADPFNVDTDGDGQGDVCDGDDDGDGVLDGVDNCPLVANTDQADLDGDDLGYVCDPDPGNDDSDDDGIPDAKDNCPDDANTDQADGDGDGLGDACDTCADDDGDGICQDVDTCPDVFDPIQLDLDGDGLGFACDPDDNNPDSDGDTVDDGDDNCPKASNKEQTNTYGDDDQGDACDDTDGDGELDVDDCQPEDPQIHAKATERCDYVDNNCDGDVDEGFVLGSVTGCESGPCEVAEMRCDDTGLSSSCQAEYADAGTECDDGNACTIDDACNDTGQCKSVQKCQSDETCDDGVCIPPPHVTCEDVLACITDCPAPVFAECTDACLEDASNAAVAEVQPVLQCIADNGCGGDDVCFAEHCGQAYAACTVEGEGELSCLEVGACQNGCQGEPGCVKACIASGTVETQGLYASMTLCIGAHCPAGTQPSQCAAAWSAHCLGALVGCYAPESGTDSCVALVGCLNGCGAETDCQQACWQAGTPEAQSTLAGGLLCTSAYCPNDEFDDASGQQACASEAWETTCGTHQKMCVHGNPCGSCDDGDDCTTDSCDEAIAQCVHDLEPAGTPCDDGDLCTIDDACDENGACQPVAATLCQSAGDCATVGCDPAQGCVVEPLPDGAACEDGDPTTFEEACDGAGTCVTSPCPFECTDATGGPNCVGGVCAACTSVDTHEPDVPVLNPPAIALGSTIVRSLCPAEETDVFALQIFEDAETLSLLVSAEAGVSQALALSIHHVEPPELVGEWTTGDVDHLVRADVTLEAGTYLVHLANQDVVSDGLSVYTLAVDVCVPDCSTKNCGDDGCGGTCGACEANELCDGGVCTALLASCSDVLSCAEACPAASWASCSQVCLDQGATEASAEAKPLLQCVMDNGCAGDLACQAAHCAAEFAACLYEGEGELGCWDVHACVADCDAEANCEQACIQSGTADAQTLLTAAGLCSEAYCPEVAAAETCAEATAEHCSDPWQACLFPTQGAEDCGTLVTCLDACAVGDWPCDAACWAAGSADAQAAMVSAALCLEAFCPADALDDVAKEACDDEAWSVECQDYANVCVFGSVCGDCEDGDLCTEATCEDGECVQHTKDCDDGDDCTVDTCSPALGCVSTLRTLPGFGGSVDCTADCALPTVTSGWTPSFARSPVNDLIVANDVVYAATDMGLEVYSLDDEHAPSPLAAYNDLGPCVGLGLDGDVLHVATRDGHVYRYQLTDPTALNAFNDVHFGDAEELVAFATDGAVSAAVGRSASFETATAYLFEVKADGGLTIGSYAAPASVLTQTHYADVAVMDDHIYLAQGSVDGSDTGLHVLSIADGAQTPTLVWSDDSLAPTALAARGGWLYVADASEGHRLMAYDVSVAWTAPAPLLVDTVDVLDRVVALHVDGELLSASIDGYGVLPVNASAEGLHKLGGDAQATGDLFTAVFGLPEEGVVVAGQSTRGLKVLGVTDASQPTQKSALEVLGHAVDVDVQGDHAYVADGDGGLAIIDISEPESPVEVGRWADHRISRVDAVGNLVFATGGGGDDYSTALRAFDVSDPTNPQEQGFIDPIHSNSAGLVAHLQVVDGVAHLANRIWLILADVSDPANIATLSEFHVGAGVTGVALAGTVTYVTHDNLLTLVDTSTPSSPTPIATHETWGAPVNGPWKTSGVTISGDMAALYGSQGVLFLDVSDPAAPSPVEVYVPSISEVTDVVFDGLHALLTLSDHGLQILKVNPGLTWPVLVGDHPTLGAANAVAVSGDHAYVADGAVALTVIGLDRPCDVDDACTIALCDVAHGCINTVPRDCDNGLYCDGVETCDAFIGCVPGTSPSDDGLPCTADSCDEAAGTVTHVPDDALCDDGDACTTDACEAGVCVHASVLCDDSDACTADLCVDGGCVPEALALPGCEACVPTVTDTATATLSDAPVGDIAFRGGVAWVATGGHVCAHALDDLHQGIGDGALATIDAANAQIERVADGFMVVSSGSGLTTWDITDPANPSDHWIGDLGAEIVDIRRRAANIVVLQEARLSVHEINTQGGGLDPRGDLALPAGHRYAAFNGPDRVVVVRETTESAELVVYDLSVLADIVAVGAPVSLQGEGLSGVKVSKNVAYVASEHGLDRVDLVGDVPVWRDDLLISGGATGIAIHEDHLYLTGGGVVPAGVHVVDISDAEGMTSLGLFPLSSQVELHGVTRHDGRAYVMAADGVHTLEFGCGENCDDGLDNDSDGEVDCEDSDCAGSASCNQSGWCTSDPTALDIERACYRACYHMASCAWDFIGEALKIVFGFGANYHDFTDACKPECIAEVTANPALLAQWRCRGDVAQTGVCPTDAVVETWEVPEVCVLPDGVEACDLTNSGCEAFCALSQACCAQSEDCGDVPVPPTSSAYGVYEVLTDTRRLAELSLVPETCELFCYGHTILDPDFGDAAACYTAQAGGVCDLPLDEGVDACAQSVCGDGVLDLGESCVELCGNGSDDDDDGLVDCADPDCDQALCGPQGCFDALWCLSEACVEGPFYAEITTTNVTAQEIVVGDLIVNGVTVGAPAQSMDSVSTQDKARSAIAKAAAIDLLAEQTGVHAHALPTVINAFVTNAGPCIEGDIDINGVSLPTVEPGDNPPEAFATAINAMTVATGGIVARTTAGDTNLQIVAPDGRNIVVSLANLCVQSFPVLAPPPGPTVYTGGLVLRSPWPVVITGNAPDHAGLIAGLISVSDVIVSVCDDGDPCTVDSCDPTTEACVFLPISGCVGFCGDGITQQTYGEECDDGNNDPADGCTNECVEEGE